MNQDAEQTLPSVEALTADVSEQQELMLTVLFHPDVRRIGQSARVPRKTSAVAWVLGRHSPQFSGGSGAEGPLADGYISREAVYVSYARKVLTLRRPSGSSRCRLAGGELLDTMQINDADLQLGVPLILSHSTVLLLKLASPHAEANTAPFLAPLLGSSATMTQLRERVLHASRSSLDVLIRGETGSGKELVAHALHAGSERGAAAMVSVNMSAVPAELASAALFGSARGAFTGADKARPGYFQQAQGSSLFLDEIGDTPADVQAQLLRALEQREIQPVGGRVTAVDVRVISATDVQLDAPDEAFRAALRHRLGACEILVPALREHPEDMGELLLHFLREAAADADRQHLLPGETDDQLLIAAWANIFFRFARYEWPGNVRQLRNYAHQIILDMQHLPHVSDVMLRAMSANVERNSDGRADGGADEEQQARDESPSEQGRRPIRIRDVPDERFAATMRECGYEIQRVAQALGVSRAAVYRRIDASSAFRLASDLTAAELRDALSRHEGCVTQAAAELQVSSSTLRSRVNLLDWR